MGGSSRRLIIAGVVTLLIGLVITFPARVAYQWFAPDDLRLSGISGSIWNGSAAEGSLGGLYVRNLDWRLKPLALLTGKLAFRTSSDPAGGFMDADIAVTGGGTIILTGVAGSLSLDLFQDSFQLQGFEGQVNVQLDRLVIRDGIPTEADGIVDVANVMAPKISRSPIGDFRAEFHTSEDGVVGSVEDVSGVLDVAGTIRIGGDRTYAFIGQVAETPRTPQSIVDQLRYLGSPDERGLREFRIEGQL